MVDTWRFRVRDDHNPWFVAVEVQADDPATARRRAEAVLFARRTVGDHTGVTIHPDGGDDG